MWRRRKNELSLDPSNGKHYIVRPGVIPTRSQRFVLDHADMRTGERQEQGGLLFAKVTSMLALVFSPIALVTGIMYFNAMGDPVSAAVVTGIFTPILLIGAGEAIALKVLERQQKKLLSSGDFVSRPLTAEQDRLGFQTTAVSSGKPHHEKYDLIDKAIQTACSLETLLAPDVVAELAQLRWNLVTLEAEFKAVNGANCDAYSREDHRLRQVALFDAGLALDTLHKTASELIEEVNATAVIDKASVHSMERKRILSLSARAAQLCEPDPDANAKILLHTYAEALKASESGYLSGHAAMELPAESSH